MTDLKIIVAEYQLTRLRLIGLIHLFGVVEEFVLKFFNQVLSSEKKHIGFCNALYAAYSAYGYACIRGTGAFAATFGVGVPSAFNGLARVRVVAITGSPVTVNIRTRRLQHFTLGNSQILCNNTKKSLEKNNDRFCR